MATKRTAWLLRIGLALVFLYAGVDSLLHPDNWVGYLPAFMTSVVAAGVAIKFLAVYELVLTVWLLSAKYSRYAALLCALTLAGIIVTNPNQLIITFRDIGLVFAALALAVAEK